MDRPGRDRPPEGERVAARASAARRAGRARSHRPHYSRHRLRITTERVDPPRRDGEDDERRAHAGAARGLPGAAGRRMRPWTIAPDEAHAPAANGRSRSPARGARRAATSDPLVAACSALMRLDHALGDLRGERALRARSRRRRRGPRPPAGRGRASIDDHHPAAQRIVPDGARACAARRARAHSRSAARGPRTKCAKRAVVAARRRPTRGGRAGARGSRSRSSCATSSQLAAHLAGDEREDDEDGERPVEEPGREVPDPDARRRAQRFTR